ncbi:MAG: hypothetical protein NT024_09235 [Proteobacteria bacterium]|nr:hypothetical protein [Pseudomonadota bacterium]
MALFSLRRVSWRQRLEELDWRVWLGVSLTFSWLALGYIYVDTTVGWERFRHMSIDRVGNFLEGGFAPLAFLWLVIGYFLQQRELAQNTEVLRMSVQQAVIQSEKMAANEMHARQETFLRVAQRVHAQLGTIAGFLYISSQAAGADGTVTNEEQSRLFAQLSQGDQEVFSRLMLVTHLTTQTDVDRFRLFYGTQIRARHANNFIYTFERLIARAKEVDPDGMICDALHSTSHGLIYNVAKRYQSEAPPDLADPTRTGTHIQF